VSDGGMSIPRRVPPIFPLATIEDLEEDLAASDRALDRLGEKPFVDLDQLTAHRARLTKWRDRIADQLDQMKAAAQ
jgi:hypothetical protein